MRRYESPEGMPRSGGPYTHAVRVGELVFTAGQCGYYPDRSLAEGVAEQTRVAIINVRQALESVGARLGDLVSITAYLVDRDAVAVFNEVYTELIPEPRPARTTVYCQLRPRVLVELTATAVVDS